MLRILVSYILSNIVSIVAIVSLKIGYRRLLTWDQTPAWKVARLSATLPIVISDMYYARISLMTSSARISLKLLKEATISHPQNNKSPTSQPLLSFYSYRRSLGTSCPTTPFSFEGTSILFVQAPELITASILAGTPPADGLVAGVTATLNNGDPSASPNCS